MLSRVELFMYFFQLGNRPNIFQYSLEWTVEMLEHYTNNKGLT